MQPEQDIAASKIEFGNKHPKRISNINITRVAALPHEERIFSGWGGVQEGETGGVVPKSHRNASNISCASGNYISLATCLYEATVRDTLANNTFIFIMMANRAFLPFIQNWLCNTADMAGVHMRTLILFSDDAGLEMIKLSPFDVMSSGVNSHLPTELNANFEYNTFGYWRLVQLRVQVIVNLTRAGIHFLLFEPDALWVQNPLLDPALFTDADLIGFDDNKGVPGFGWLRVRPNARVLLLFTEMERTFSVQMPHGSPPPNSVLAIQGEQDILHILIQTRANKAYKDLTFQMLSQTKYSSGKWYDGGRGGDGIVERKACKADGMPFVINNNWIVGNVPKIIRAKRWGHWFVQNELAGSCDNQTQLQRTFHQMLNTMHTMRPPYGDPLSTECPKC